MCMRGRAACIPWWEGMKRRECACSAHSPQRQLIRLVLAIAAKPRTAVLRMWAWGLEAM